MATEIFTDAIWTADPEHPCARFAADCRLQSDISQSLLAVADSLPGSLNATAISVLSKLVQATWTAHLILQSQAILPLIEQRHGGVPDLGASLALLERQHLQISALNDELTACFDMVVQGEAVEIGMLGYLLRNAAERRHEHVAWEKVLLGPLLPQTLSPGERGTFADWAAANPWPFEGFKALAASGGI